MPKLTHFTVGQTCRLLDNDEGLVVAALVVDVTTIDPWTNEVTLEWRHGGEIYGFTVPEMDLLAQLEDEP